MVLLSDPTPHPIHALQSTYIPLPSEGGRGGEEVLSSQSRFSKVAAAPEAVAGEAPWQGGQRRQT